MSPADIQLILAPLLQSSFQHQALGRTFLHIPGESENFSKLLSWQTLNGILSRAALTFPRVRITKGKQTLRADRVYREDSIGIPQILLPEFYAILREGATVKIESFEQLHEPIADLAESFEALLQIPVSMGLEVTTCGTLDSARRWNDHHLIVFQISGSKRWTVHEPTRTFPTVLDRPEEPTCDAVWQHSLGSGDFLYLPRGWWYLTTSINEPTLALTISFRIPSGLDILTRLLDRLNGIEFMRQDYPLFAGAEIQSNYLTQIKREVLRECGQAGLILDFFKDVRAMAEPRKRFSLPWAASDFDLPETFVVVPLKRFQFPRAPNHRGYLEIGHDGKSLRGEEEMWLLFDCLADSPGLTVRQLRERLGEEITEERYLELLSELLRRGIAAVQPSGDFHGPSRVTC